MSRSWPLAPAVALLLAGCSSGEAKTAPLPPKPAEMSVTMAEYRFDHPPEIAAGRVIFRIHNAGEIDHKLEMVVLPEDFEGTLDAQLHSDVRVPLAGVASIARQRPSDDEVFAVDLPPGKYGFLCFTEFPEGGTHALRGMSSQFVVR